MPHVYSTLTQTQHYQNYRPNVSGNVPLPDGCVTIKGGSNVATKSFDTPRGVRTKITNEQLEILRKNFVFQQHEKSGHVVVRDDKVDPEVAVAKDMEQKDGSAPMTPETIKLETLKAGAAPETLEEGGEASPQKGRKGS